MAHLSKLGQASEGLDCQYGPETGLGWKSTPIPEFATAIRADKMGNYMVGEPKNMVI